MPPGPLLLVKGGNKHAFQWERLTLGLDARRLDASFFRFSSPREPLQAEKEAFLVAGEGTAPPPAYEEVNKVEGTSQEKEESQL